MKEKGKKRALCAGLAVLALLVALAIYLYWTLPVYPSPEQPVKSFSELRERMGDHDETKDMIVLELSDFGADSQAFYVYMDGRTRGAKPYRYYVRAEKAGAEDLYTLWVAGEIWKSEEIPQEKVYRDVPGKQVSGDTKLPGQENASWRYIELTLVQGGFGYTVGGAFDLTGLTESEISEREASLLTTLHEMADLLLDAPKGNAA